MGALSKNAMKTLRAKGRKREDNGCAKERRNIWPKQGRSASDDWNRRKNSGKSSSGLNGDEPIMAHKEPSTCPSHMARGKND